MTKAERRLVEAVLKMEDSRKHPEDRNEAASFAFKAARIEYDTALSQVRREREQAAGVRL